jgi:hypothetical protein
MQAAKITRNREDGVLLTELSVMVSPPVWCGHSLLGLVFLALKHRQKRPRCRGRFKDQAALVK